MYEVCTYLRISRKRPNEGFDEAVTSVQESSREYRYEVPNGIQASVNSANRFASKRRALSRDRHHRRLKGNALDATLPELLVTNNSKEFLQLKIKTEGRRFLLFYAEKYLEVPLNNSVGRQF